MNADDYMAQRLEDEIAWYDRKSLSCQHWYKRLRTAEFIVAAFIPFLAAYLAPDLPATKVVIGLLGVMIAVITGILGLYQFQEHWIEYRATGESLKKERFLFLTSTDPYKGESKDNFQLLVQRVEALVSKENTNWAQYMIKPKEEGNTVC